MNISSSFTPHALFKVLDVNNDGKLTKADAPETAFPKLDIATPSQLLTVLRANYFDDREIFKQNELAAHQLATDIPSPIRRIGNFFAGLGFGILGVLQIPFALWIPPVMATMRMTFFASRGCFFQSFIVPGVNRGEVDYWLKTNLNNLTVDPLPNQQQKRPAPVVELIPSAPPGMLPPPPSSASTGVNTVRHCAPGEFVDDIMCRPYFLD